MMRDVEGSNGMRRAPAPAAAAHPAMSRDDMSYRAGPLERMPKQSSSWDASAPTHCSSGTNNKVAGWRPRADADVPSALNAAARAPPTWGRRFPRRQGVDHRLRLQRLL